MHALRSVLLLFSTLLLLSKGWAEQEPSICVVNFFAKRHPISKYLRNVYWPHHDQVRMLEGAVPRDLLRCASSNAEEILIVAHSAMGRGGNILLYQRADLSLAPVFDQAFVLLNGRHDEFTRLKRLRIMACNPGGILMTYRSLRESPYKIEFAPVSKLLSWIHGVGGAVSMSNSAWLLKSLR